jgi:ABC-2 type transport system ATP-binding protein
MNDQSVQTAIEVASLSKDYGSLKALDNVTFKIEPGESVGLIGANGAGKSTLINILMGFTSYDFEQCNASILGNSCKSVGPELKQRIGYVAEEVALLPWSSLMDTAELYSTLYPSWDRSFLEELIKELDIQPYKPVKSMSKGQRRLADLALCLSIRPEILLLDEPFSSLDALMRLKVMDILRRLNREFKTTMLYSTHILSEVNKIAHRIIILNRGKLVQDKAIDDLDGSVEKEFVDKYGLSLTFDK